jgi:hypothetical protein
MSRWTREQANEWYAAQPWRVGCNFIPSTAINQLEMWQADTWDPETIKKELGWAVSLGMNSARVSLHDLAYDADPEGFKERVKEFLGICDELTVRPLFVFFDDCWNPEPQTGQQPEPKPQVHNSGWVMSPSREVKNNQDKQEWDRLEHYVTDILTTFATDERVLLWDLYNEPGNSAQGDRSLPLLKSVFEWARAVEELSQPLTVGMWSDKLVQYNEFVNDHSDVISFHHYGDANSLRLQIQELQNQGRPLFCTEWLRRPVSTVQSHLQIFKKENVACYNWGLVAGKSNTIWPWEQLVGTDEYTVRDGQPVPWFHDLLNQDGSPYDPEELETFRQLTS